MDEVQLHLDHFHKDAVFKYGPLHRAGLLGLLGRGHVQSTVGCVCPPLCPRSSLVLLDTWAQKAVTQEQNDVNVP